MEVSTPLRRTSSCFFAQSLALLSAVFGDNAEIATPLDAAAFDFR
jgi:hypothetical protein